jgi:hypothetical protein
MNKYIDRALTVAVVVGALTVVGSKAYEHYKSLPPVRPGVGFSIDGEDLSKPTLIAFTSPDCKWCAKSENQWHAIFPLIHTIVVVPTGTDTTRYLSGFHDLQFRSLKRVYPVTQSTPTLVLVNRSKIVSVWKGYQSEKQNDIVEAIKKEIN